MYIFEQYNPNKNKITSFISGLIGFLLFQGFVFTYLFVFLNTTLKEDFYEIFYISVIGVSAFFSIVRLLLLKGIYGVLSKSKKMCIGIIISDKNLTKIVNDLQNDLNSLFDVRFINKNTLHDDDTDNSQIDLLVIDDELCYQHQTWTFNKIIQKNPRTITLSDLYEQHLQKMPIHKSIYEFNLLKINAKSNLILRIQNIFCLVLNSLLVILLLPILSLLILTIPILNLFFNKGPLFYKQKRIGLDNREFFIYKFRTMIINAEANGIQMTQKKDSRITVLGHWLRMVRIDEIPQIISILKGDMNFIGPRPERKYYVDKIMEKHEVYQLRHLIKPGITGWAQVSYRYGENIEDSVKKLGYDLYYIKNRSVFLDLRILLKTMSAVLFSKGM